jgi:hypothetical protein
MAGAMGPVALTELELLAYQVNRRRFLQPWEVKFLRRLSSEFVGMHAEAGDSTCPAPWRPGKLNREEATAVTRSLFADLRGEPE